MVLNTQVNASLGTTPQTRHLDRWRNRNLYYYKDIERFHRFLLRPGARVLEVGSGLGYLLDAVSPSYGVGIDINPAAIDYAQKRFPDLKFLLDDAHDFTLYQTFDYILLANSVSYFENIQKTLDNICHVCNPSTRLVFTFHNPAWEPILTFATRIGQRMPLPPLNWLSLRDIENLLDLANYEIVAHYKRILLPKHVPFLSWFCNSIIAPLPLINQMCLAEFVVARVRPITVPVSQPISHDLTCSVIIPARNEAGNIENCIRRLPRLGKHTEIIFVEGNSSDNTWDEICRVQLKYGNQFDIKAYQQTGKGKGDAVRLGFKEASGDILVILDSDLTVQPEDLIHFFNAIASGKCELANGCRLIYPINPSTMPVLNQMANRFFAWLLSYLLNTKIKDSLCGTKAISKSNYERMSANRAYFGDFDPFGDFDLLFGAAKLGLKIQDIPVRYVPRTYGESNIRHVKEGFVLLRMCMHAARKMKFI
ncbi:MAG: glycosyltransferase [Elainellaceae cyanobacterium]